MIDIKILLENTSYSNRVKSKHGLSIAIFPPNFNLLLDVGPDKTFFENANIMGVDIKTIDTLILSHSHIDHGGGLDTFCRENKSAEIYMFENGDYKYYTKLAGPIKLSVGLIYSEETRKRIKKINQNIKLKDNTWFLKNITHIYKTPRFNDSLFLKKDSKVINDDFNHEGILVIEENGELVLFNSCSHNGVLNSIETVSSEFPGKKIRSYIGGFHFYNPITKKHEKNKDLDDFIQYVKTKGIRFYTGHCTGDYCYNYLKNSLGEMIQKIQSGMELSV